MNSPTARLIALAVDGTLLNSGMEAPPVTVRAVTAARTAGHYVVLATRRSLTGTAPVARNLGLADGWVAASNGAVIARLDPTAPGGYVVEIERTLEVDSVVQLARSRMPSVRIGVEKTGWGYYVTHPFDAGQISGVQRVVEHLDEQGAAPAPRMILSGPGVTVLLEPLRRLGVTATPNGPNWVDVTARGLSKATALETIRGALHVDHTHTVAIGDGWKDREMFAWAADAIAMGNAPEAIKALANHTTGTLHENGAAAALQRIVTPGSPIWLAPPVSSAIGPRRSAAQVPESKTMPRTTTGHSLRPSSPSLSTS